MRQCISLIVLVLSLAAASTSSATAPPEREPYAAAGIGVAQYVVLPSFRVFARYALHPISFEIHAGVFAPTFAIGEFVYELAAGPRIHFLQRDTIVGFVAPRVGLWDIGPPSDDEDDGNLVVTERRPSTRRHLNPVATVSGGADFFLGSFVLTAELGGGLLWSPQRFNTDAPIPLIEISGKAGWVF